MRLDGVNFGMMENGREKIIFGCLIDREKRVSFDGTQVFSPLAHQKSIFPNPRENKEEEYVKCEITWVPHLLLMLRGASFLLACLNLSFSLFVVVAAICWNVHRYLHFFLIKLFFIIFWFFLVFFFFKGGWNNLLLLYIYILNWQHYFWSYIIIIMKKELLIYY